MVLAKVVAQLSVADSYEEWCQLDNCREAVEVVLDMYRVEDFR